MIMMVTLMLMLMTVVVSGMAVDIRSLVLIGDIVSMCGPFVTQDDPSD